MIYLEDKGINDLLARRLDCLTLVEGCSREANEVLISEVANFN